MQPVLLSMSIVVCGACVNRRFVICTTSGNNYGGHDNFTRGNPSKTHGAMLLRYNGFMTGTMMTWLSTKNFTYLNSLYFGGFIIHWSKLTNSWCAELKRIKNYNKTSTTIKLKTCNENQLPWESRAKSPSKNQPPQISSWTGTCT